MEASVAEVMTRCPVSVRAETPFHTVAATLSARRIGAVPVVDDLGHPVGVVSEIDLLRAGRDLAGLTAADLMSGPVVTVGPSEPLTAAAGRLARAAVRRLFVVEDKRLMGVVTRGDLLRGYLRDDDEIREQVERELVERPPGRHAVVRASVSDGVVQLLGRVEYRSELGGIDWRVRAVPGVVEVRNRLSFLWDDG